MARDVHNDQRCSSPAGRLPGKVASPRSRRASWLSPTPAGNLLAAFGLYLGAALVLYWSSLRAWFLADDVMIISEVADLGLLQVLGHAQSFGNFVPMMYISLWFDFKLFGLEPTGFRIHSILACVVAATLVFQIMRRFCPVEVALLAGACFMFAPPTVAVTTWICTRHYIEGTIPCLLAVLVIIRYLETPSTLKAVAAGSLYFLACISKEIFAALPVALAFLPIRLSADPQGGSRWSPRVLLADAEIRKRLKLALALLAGMAAYVVWRKIEVGAVFSRYGFDMPFSDRMAYFFSAWPQFTGWMLSQHQRPPALSLAFFVVHALMVVSVVALARMHRLLAAFAVALFVAASLPSAMIISASDVRFLDIANHFCLRFIYLPSVVVLLLGVLAVSRTLPRLASSVILVALLLFVHVAGTRQVRPWVISGEKTRRAADVYHQWWDKRAVIASDISPWLHQGLQRIWILEEGEPEVLARVFSTRGRGKALPPAADDPYLEADDVVFIEDLQWRDISRQLTRQEYLDTYATTESDRCINR